MHRIIPHCNKRLVGLLTKDCVRNRIFVTLKDLVTALHVTKEISGRGRRRIREKGNQGVGAFRSMYILQLFSSFFSQLL